MATSISSVAEAFLSDIINNPEDDTPRLIYADWLQDNGQAPYAAFIRVQIQLAAAEKAGMEAIALKEQELELWWSFYPRSVFPSFLSEFLKDTFFYRTVEGGCKLRLVAKGGMGASVYSFAEGALLFEYRRGFIEHFWAEEEYFHLHCKKIFLAAPITAVTLVSKNPLSYTVMNKGEIFRWAQNSDLRRLVPNQTRLIRGHYELNQELFELLDGNYPGRWHYDTEEEAQRDLSRVCVKLGRQRAGLPELFSLPTKGILD